MNKDTQVNTHFNRAPTLYKGRTKFDLSHSILTTFNTGELVPILCEPVYPGDTFSLKTASLTRLTTSLHQTMDNAYLEFAFFFVPSRILWKDFDQYQGFNKDAWARLSEVTKPQLILSGVNATASVGVGSLLDHLGVPVGSYGGNSVTKKLTIDLLPLRAVFSCYNHYFRDQNLETEIYYDNGSYDAYLSTTYLVDGSYFNPSTSCLKVNRFKDMFSTALPAPQKSANPVSFSLSGLAPVVLGENSHTPGAADLNLTWAKYDYNDEEWVEMDGLQPRPIYVTGDGSDTRVMEEGSTGSFDSIAPNNLYADLSGISSVTINELRLAIALQSKYERDARSGNRLKEKLWSVWHVDAPSLELDMPEFLGGKRIPVSMMEVLQTSETGTTVLGTDAGHSKTSDYDESFIKSFTQWGYIVGFCFVRTSRSYSQGIDRKFFVKNLIDEFDPLFDNIGEMPVYKKELYAALEKDDVFGYQEAWYWLKSRSNRFSGYFTPGITGTLETWHYGDKYNGAPSLSSSWLQETSNNVERTLAVTKSFQWEINVHFDLSATREMSKYSIPNTFGF